MGRVFTGYGNIGYVEAGRGDSAPIIFLHGVGSDKSVWRPQLDHFGRERRAIAFDYPGYGESDFAPGAGRDEFAEAILAAMDELGVGQAHVCGLSLGGVVAIAMYHAAPGRCTSLIIADSFAVHPNGQVIHDRSVAASKAMTMRALAEARTGMLLGTEASDALRREVIETMAVIDPDAYRLGAAAVWLADQCGRAAAIDVPTLILCGIEDGITPPALSSELHEIIHNSRLEWLEGSGHLANLEQPERFNSAIDRFLSETETRV
jgi:3-oxoadipate enol-lactonase